MTNDNKTVSEVCAVMRGIDTLKGDADEDYWKATEGNARQALFCLKQLCEIARFECPDEELVLGGD